MFLTRIGFGSKAVVTGDITQIDLPSGRASGLIARRGVMEGVEGIRSSTSTEKDVVRHPLVQKIVSAYDRFERARGGAGDRAAAAAPGAQAGASGRSAEAVATRNHDQPHASRPSAGLET